jgi:hypothetical protein
MKIRKGFVSNSSSSSFVVAFKYRPKNEQDVLDMMFDGKDGTLSKYDDSMTHKEIAKRVFRDISSVYKSCEDSMDIYDVARVFQHRYGYTSNAITFLDVDENNITTRHRSNWYDRGEFWGSDNNLLNKIAEKSAARENLSWTSDRDEYMAAEKEIGSLCMQLSIIDAENFIDNANGNFIVKLEYADDGGEGLLEHGDIFRNLTHIRISNH